MRRYVEKNEDKIVNVIVGTIVFGVLVLIATGVVGCVISALVFGGIIGMAYL